MKTELSRERELNPEGWRGSEIGYFSIYFSRPAPEPPYRCPRIILLPTWRPKCPKVVANAHQYLSKIVYKWSLEFTCYPIGSQNLPGLGQGLKKVPKVIKNNDLLVVLLDTFEALLCFSFCAACPPPIQDFDILLPFPIV